MTTLHPDLLRACAAYLAHADVYCLDSDDQMALLRADAHHVAVGYGCTIEDSDVRVARWQEITGPSACDELTRTHLEAIRHHARYRPGSPALGAIKRDWESISRAILDATPAMLAWWCERLAR